MIQTISLIPLNKGIVKFNFKNFSSSSVEQLIEEYLDSYIPFEEYIILLTYSSFLMFKYNPFKTFFKRLKISSKFEQDLKQFS